MKTTHGLTYRDVAAVLRRAFGEDDSVMEMVALVALELSGQSQNVTNSLAERLRLREWWDTQDWPSPG